MKREPHANLGCLLQTLCPCTPYPSSTVLPLPGGEARPSQRLGDVGPTLPIIDKRKLQPGDVSPANLHVGSKTQWLEDCRNFRPWETFSWSAWVHCSIKLLKYFHRAGKKLLPRVPPGGLATPASLALFLECSRSLHQPATTGVCLVWPAVPGPCSTLWPAFMQNG